MEFTDHKASPASTSPPSSIATHATGRHPKRRQTWIWVGGGAVALALVAAYTWGGVKPVAVVSPQWLDVTEAVATSGVVEGRTETTLGADAQGTVAALYVQENQQVKAGQLLARIRNRAAEAQIRQAEATLGRTRAQLSQAKVGATQDELDASRSRIDQANEGVTQAEALYRQAGTAQRQTDAQYRQAQGGLERAQTAVDQAQSRYVLAAKTLDRVRRLTTEGALAGSKRDEAQSAYEVAEAALRDAREAVEVAQDAVETSNLAREAAKDSLVAAQSRSSQARAARAGAVADLRNLVSLPRSESVLLAEAQVREAFASLDNARRIAANGEIRAPFAGTVTQLLCREGGTIGQQGLLRLVETSRLEAKADVDESNLESLRVGQRVVLTATSDPERKILGRVSTVDAHVDMTSGTVRIAVVPDEASGLRAGQTVDLNVIVHEKVRRLVVPAAAVRRRGDDTIAFAIVAGRATARVVKVGQTSDERVAILGGLSPRDQVVADATPIQDGQRIRVRR